MFCAISGLPPLEPVLSPHSGHVFERSLISKALAASGGKCPVTGADLAEGDLIAVRVSGDIVAPVPASAATLPGLLAHMRAEWDAAALESFGLKKALAGAHQELATALYKYDAATRVIVRLTKERDEARALGRATEVVEVAAEGVAMEEEKKGEEQEKGVDGREDGEESVALGKDVLAKIKVKHGEMTAGRLKRKKSTSPASATRLKQYVETHSAPLQPDVAVTSLQRVRSPEEETDVVHAGCSDGSIRLFSGDNLSVCGVGVVKAHTGAVTHLAHNALIHPSLLFSGGADGFVRGWSTATLGAPAAPAGDAPEETRERDDVRSTRQRKASDVTAIPDPVLPSIELAPEDASAPSPLIGVAAHPCSDLVVSAVESGRWRVHDAEGGQLLGAGWSRGKDGDGGAHSFAIHPDGAIFAVGLKDGTVDVWDMNQASAGVRKPVAELRQAGAVAGDAASITLSENGYYMTVSGNGFVRLWDLRKKEIAREARIADDEVQSPGLGVTLDWSGLFCAATVGNGSVRLFETRKMKRIADVGLGGVSAALGTASVGIAWGTDAQCLYAPSGRGRLARIGLLPKAPVEGDGEEN